MRKGDVRIARRNSTQEGDPLCDFVYGIVLLMISRIALLCFLSILPLSVVDAFDHTYAGYSRVLAMFVRDGMVDYARLQKDRDGVDQFVLDLSKVSESEYDGWTRNQQLAYWINAYNGWFLKIVVDHYPIKRSGLIGLGFPPNSVQQINGIWDNIKVVFAGRMVSLNYIEHRVLRPIFQEPRIHFAIVCASVGCPVLRSEPFVPDKLEEQLDLATRNFILSPAKVRLEKDRRRISISKIFDWFHDDFAAFADEDWRQNYSESRAGSLSFISRYFSDSDAAFLKQNKVAVDFLDYDWSLNDIQK